MLSQKASKILQRASLRNTFCGSPSRCINSLARGNRQSLSRLSNTSRLEGRFCGSVTKYNFLGQNYGVPKYFHCSAILGNDIRTVSTPPFPDSVAEGDISWEKAVGDQVEEDEVIGEIETDKTALPVSSPVAGVIVELLVADGDTVEKGQELCRIDASGGGAAPSKPTEAPAAEAPAAEKPAQAEAPPTQPTPEKVEREIPTTPPPVPEMPKEPLKTVKPTPPPIPITASQPAPSTTGVRSETRVKMTRMRQRIAGRLKEAQDTAAMLTTFNEVDMSNIMEMRKQHKDSFLKKHNVKLGFMSAFVKASAHALQEIPVVNAVIDDDDNQIIYRDYIDISVAVATPKGLVVPVIRNVEAMNFADIEKTINSLGEKARDGNLAIEEMDGGTFTISNGGVFGSLMGTPIINPPQSAILGIHAINDRPVAINGKVEIRPMMYLALTYDHRLIDGREAVTFLRKIKSTVEDPRTILLDL
ncbi:dihydrolipoyllysine-residue succinyltransferase component of 2-oxoglutarate dehydrogenase complex, mitochondrial-like [Dendronephthya gigantea]|uniref:dihydrolipoyllysine-residue succinyltransferase component of 2-oxoglutarate dehydrogenase complex, mitochondrial-like n=1 Tax=Dendronephthya gigantea TaxID=151771 RepID=UPI00106CE0DB|nr:dihydrolipoyllysine-residue succinyltransferase component of 2-oxoglutarate dehydrogenase complex, mitochondrial-like [Dendronephthya gigantea]